jgi:hypothetical protein
MRTSWVGSRPRMLSVLALGVACSGTPGSMEAGDGGANTGGGASGAGGIAATAGTSTAEGAGATAGTSASEGGEGAGAAAGASTNEGGEGGEGAFGPSASGGAAGSAGEAGTGCLEENCAAYCLMLDESECEQDSSCRSHMPWPLAEDGERCDEPRFAACVAADLDCPAAASFQRGLDEQCWFDLNVCPILSMDEDDSCGDAGDPPPGCGL